MKVCLLLPNGYEELEAIAVVDLLRRASIPVDLVSITGSLETVGDHQVRIQADRLIEEIDPDEYQMLVTPGGLPGTLMLSRDERVLDLMRKFAADKTRWIASICASPLVLRAAGISAHHAGTCYPGCEGQVQFKEYKTDLVVQDGHLITSQGPGTAILFALHLVELLSGSETRRQIESGLLWDRLPFTETVQG